MITIMAMVMIMMTTIMAMICDEITDQTDASDHCEMEIIDGHGDGECDVDAHANDGLVFEHDVRNYIDSFKVQ